MVNITVREKAEFKDGEYTGKIIRLDYRDTPFEYIDAVIEEDNSETELKTGFPAYISITKDGKPSSMCAKFLSSLGVDLSAGTIDLDAINVALEKSPIRVKFYVSVNEDGFARVLRDSIRKI